MSHSILYVHVIQPQNKSIFQHDLLQFQNFLYDLLKQSKKEGEVSEEQLITYADTMVTGSKYPYAVHIIDKFFIMF